jgi:chromosomal replication initiator protein
VVSGVFSIPLDAHGAASTFARGKAEGPALPLREFIADETNALARVVADTILAGDSRYNPLVLFGPTGTGKSHLIRGLIQQRKQQHPRTKAMLTTGADFARAYAEAVDTDSVADLRAKYRAAHLFFLDNLHELSNKRAAQQELIHTIDELLEHHRQIVVTSHQSPVEMHTLAPGLTSRLSAGLVVPLAEPGVPARHEILKRLAAIHELNADDEAFRVLADRLSANVPELNNSIVQLKLGGGNSQPIDAAAVKRYLAQREPSYHATLRTITTRVCRYFQLKSSDLKSPTRRQGVVRARGIAMYLARQLTDKSLSEVGQHFGGRDHTTVINALNKTETLLQSDPATQQAVSDLMGKLAMS